ncbi:unnamed protein product, partial [Cyprideis torosa]
FVFSGFRCYRMQKRYREQLTQCRLLAENLLTDTNATSFSSVSGAVVSIESAVLVEKPELFFRGSEVISRRWVSKGDSSSSSEAEEEDVNLKECQQKLARYVACNMQRKHINRSEIRQLFPSKLTPNEWTAVLQGANDLLKDVFGLKLVPSESGKQGAMILISLLRPIPSQHCVLDGSYTSGEAAALSMILLHLFLSRKNETTPGCQY